MSNRKYETGCLEPVVGFALFSALISVALIGKPLVCWMLGVEWE